MKHEFDICRDGAVYRPGSVRLRTDAEVQAYLACFDARWPPTYLRVSGLINQFERLTDALR